MSKSIAIVGGGFYGLTAALLLSKIGNTVTVFEQESKLMQRASLYNQARVHGGYHYPRSLNTAARCRANYQRFISDYREAVSATVNSFYGIAKGSLISTNKYERLMNLIGAPLESPPAWLTKSFNDVYIENIYKVAETTFNANILCEIITSRLKENHVQVMTNTEVSSIYKQDHNGKPKFEVFHGDKTKGVFDGLIMATYGLDNLDTSIETRNHYIYEVCELVKMRVPERLKENAITLMDGPFWSLTPWPARECHVLTHVRYTPHGRFSSFSEANYYLKTQHHSRSDIMLADVKRYTSIFNDAEILGSEFTIKTILKKRENDDGRPIFLDKHQGIISILGSKIDNIYEMETTLHDFSIGLK